MALNCLFQQSSSSHRKHCDADFVTGSLRRTKEEESLALLLLPDGTAAFYPAGSRASHVAAAHSALYLTSASRDVLHPSTRLEGGATYFLYRRSSSTLRLADRRCCSCEVPQELLPTRTHDVRRAPGSVPSRLSTQSSSVELEETRRVEESRRMEETRRGEEARRNEESQSSELPCSHYYRKVVLRHNSGSFSPTHKCRCYHPVPLVPAGTPADLHNCGAVEFNHAHPSAPECSTCYRDAGCRCTEHGTQNKLASAAGSRSWREQGELSQDQSLQAHEAQVPSSCQAPDDVYQLTQRSNSGGPSKGSGSGALSRGSSSGFVGKGRNLQSLGLGEYEAAEAFAAAAATTGPTCRLRVLGIDPMQDDVDGYTEGLTKPRAWSQGSPVPDFSAPEPSLLGITPLPPSSLLDLGESGHEDGSVHAMAPHSPKPGGRCWTPPRVRGLGTTPKKGGRQLSKDVGVLPERPIAQRTEPRASPRRGFAGLKQNCCILSHSGPVGLSKDGFGSLPPPAKCGCAFTGARVVDHWSDPELGMRRATSDALQLSLVQGFLPTQDGLALAGAVSQGQRPQPSPSQFSPEIPSEGSREQFHSGNAHTARGSASPAAATAVADVPQSDRALQHVQPESVLRPKAKQPRLLRRRQTLSPLRR